MNDLIAFLRARLDEDETVAKTAEPNFRSVMAAVPTQFAVAAQVDVEEHMRRHVPARVLREAEAKRAIVTRCELVLAAFADRAAGAWPDVSRRERTHADATLCALAAVYSDHPDYRAEWAA